MPRTRATGLAILAGMNKLLLIDDDVELLALLGEYLAAEGFAIALAHDGESGAAAALAGNYDLVVLDVMMPRVDGIEALRRIRESSQVPVLMLTARGDDADRITGLELGADDYVPKPCTPRELLARIRAILRRVRPLAGSEAAEEVLEAGMLTMWPAARRAEWQGEVLDLTSTEFNLLEVLARAVGRTVSKEALSERGMGRPLARFDRAIDVHVSSLRQKLGKLADGRSCIQTVYRQGYQLIRA